MLSQIKHQSHSVQILSLHSDLFEVDECNVNLKTLALVLVALVAVQNVHNKLQIVV